MRGKPTCALLLAASLCAGPAFAQTAQNKANRSTLEVKPGTPAVKTSELNRKPAAPWKRLPGYILHDQASIWTSPIHTSKQDAKWWAIFGGVTAGLIASDKWTSRQLPNTASQVSVATWSSRLGAAYTLIPLTGAFYLLGVKTGDDQFRETSFLGFEALADALVVDTALKAVSQRQRPTEGNGSGRFWQGTGRTWNGGSSFPSGHAIETWSLASVIAHEYPHPRIVPILAYGLATTVVGSRFAARKHFASDLVAGAAMGWFIGDFVFARRHNPATQGNQSRLQRFLAHVHFGGLE